MLEKLAVKIQKTFNLKNKTGVKFLIIPLFTELPVAFLGLPFLVNNIHPYDWLILLWIFICVFFASICLYYEKK